MTIDIIYYVFSALTFLMIAYQTYIQRTQINVSKDIMDKFKSFNEIFDLNKLKQYSELVSENSRLEYENRRIQFEQSFLNDLNELKKNKEAYEQTNLELNKVFFMLIMYEFTHDGRRRFIQDYLPTNSELYLKLLEEHESKWVESIDNGASTAISYLTGWDPFLNYRSYYQILKWTTFNMKFNPNDDINRSNNK
jgi:hypothetical protein